MRPITNGIVLILIFCQKLFAQDSVSFSYEDFISLVRENHPMVQQASNAVSLANADVLKSKGSFDPKLEHESNNKRFDDKNYYQLSNTAVKIPTWFGIEVKGGYEQNRGDFLSGENQTPGSGLWYGGISMPLGKNLFIDERRKMLKQAQTLREQSEVDQRIILSDLILSASESYWNWYRSYYLYSINVVGLNLAEERLKAVKVSAELGENAKIDTLEATLMRDYRKLELEQSRADAAYFKAIMEVYLWAPGIVPLELNDSVRPSKINITPSIYHNISPDSTVWISKFEYKLEYLAIEERYRKEMLKPEIDLVYNPLLQPTGNGFMPFSASNMKFGISASMPLFLRKERGELASIRVKQSNTALDKNLKRLELENKMEGIRKVCVNLEQQYTIQQDVINSSKKMRDAELLKFDIGESSLFLVNTREMKYLESLLKEVELVSKLNIYRAQYNWLTTE
jgi:outer membrane protein TolC